MSEGEGVAAVKQPTSCRRSAQHQPSNCGDASVCPPPGTGLPSQLHPCVERQGLIRLPQGPIPPTLSGRARRAPTPPTFILFLLLLLGGRQLLATGVHLGLRGGAAGAMEARAETPLLDDVRETPNL